MRSLAKKIPSAMLTATILLAFILFLIFPARYAEAVRQGISLWAVSVLPATLFMLVLTALLTRRSVFHKAVCAVAPLSETLFAVSGAGGCAAILSAVSGYPVGAKTVSDFARRGYLRSDVFRAACLATTSGPAFLVGAVGCGMFRSAAAGWILYGSHLAGILAVCILLRLPVKQAPRGKIPPNTESVSLASVLQNSVLSVLTVGAAIAVFYVFGEMITDMVAAFSLPPILDGILKGLLEMTSGCAAFAQNRTALSLSVCCFFVTFGGLSAIVQQLAFLQPIGIKTAPFILVKFVQGLLSALICFAAAELLPLQL